jgi:hypothetical protein
MSLQPWQRHTVDVAGELVPDAETGDLVHAYSIVTVSVGRRGGKSLLTLAELVSTVTGGRRRFCYYAAQNGKAGAERFRNDWIPLVTSAPHVLSGRLKSRLTNGTETLTDPALQSFFRIFSPIPTALHGDAADLIVFDEAWAHDAERGADLEVASFPLMATRPGAQLWIMSAAGDIDSTWWAQWLDTGRAAAAADVGRGHCHIEYTADHADVDPATYADEQVWIDSHPAIRHPGNPTGTVPLSFLRDEYDRDPGQFARSYLNITDRTGTTSAPIDLDAWHALEVDPPTRETIALGVDVSPDQASGAIVAAHHDGRAVTLEVLDHRPGHDWIPGRVADVFDRYDVDTVAADVAGQSPAAVLARPLEALGVPVRTLTLPDITASAADLLAAVRSGTVRHVPHPALDLAVKGARRRPIGDGSWAWGRRDTDVDVSPLIAATFARWVHPDTLGAAPPAIA